jgi:hypothetical protein
MAKEDVYCPRCREAVLIEWDGTLRLFYCLVCSWAWARDVREGE